MEVQPELQCLPPTSAEEDVVPQSYINIKVARDGDLFKQIGKDIYLDLVNHDKVSYFPVPTEMPFDIFKENFARLIGIPVPYQRFWIWTKRENRTYRPYRPLTPDEEIQPVGLLVQLSNEAKKEELKLLLEVNTSPNLRLLPPPEKTDEKILLFFKLYDPFKEELRYVGRMFVNCPGKPIEILTKLKEMVGFALEEEIELFKEIRFEPNVTCERIDKKVNFCSSELKDGDIICFQKCGYPDVPKFLKYVHNRKSQVVRSRSLGKAIG